MAELKAALDLFLLLISTNKNKYVFTYIPTFKILKKIMKGKIYKIYCSHNISNSDISRNDVKHNVFIPGKRSSLYVLVDSRVHRQLSQDSQQRS